MNGILFASCPRDARACPGRMAGSQPAAARPTPGPAPASIDLCESVRPGVPKKRFASLQNVEKRQAN